MVWFLFGCFGWGSKDPLHHTSDSVLPPQLSVETDVPLLLPPPSDSHILPPSAFPSPQRLKNSDPWSRIDQLADELEDLRKRTEEHDNISEEVAFLKSCGTLSQTPSEMRKSKREDETNNGRPDSDKSWHSWFLPSPPATATVESASDEKNVIRGLQLVTCSSTPAKCQSSSIVSMRGRTNIKAIRNDLRNPPWTEISTTIRQPPSGPVEEIDVRKPVSNLCIVSSSQALPENPSPCAYSSEATRCTTTGQQDSAITSSLQMEAISSTCCLDHGHNFSTSGLEESVTSCTGDKMDLDFCCCENLATVTSKGEARGVYNDEDDAETDDCIDPCFDAMSHVPGSKYKSHLEAIDSEHCPVALLSTPISGTTSNPRNSSRFPVLTPVTNLCHLQHPRDRENNKGFIPDSQSEKHILECLENHSWATSHNKVSQSIIEDVPEDEPIKGMAADTHCLSGFTDEIEEDESVCGSINEKQLRAYLQRWDGMGIPNTTTKYKEDQKVRWYSSPFVVRLERELSKQETALQTRNCYY